MGVYPYNVNVYNGPYDGCIPGKASSACHLDVDGSAYCNDCLTCDNSWACKSDSDCPAHYACITGSACHGNNTVATGEPMCLYMLSDPTGTKGCFADA